MCSKHHPSIHATWLHAPTEGLVLSFDNVRNLTMAVSRNTSKIRLYFFFQHFLSYILWRGSAGLESAWRFCDAVLSLELRIKVQAAFLQALGWRSKRQSWLHWNKKKKSLLNIKNIFGSFQDSCEKVWFVSHYYFYLQTAIGRPRLPCPRYRTNSVSVNNAALMAHAPGRPFASFINTVIITIILSEQI